MLHIYTLLETHIIGHPPSLFHPPSSLRLTPPRPGFSSAGIGAVCVGAVCGALQLGVESEGAPRRGAARLSGSSGAPSDRGRCSGDGAGEARQGDRGMGAWVSTWFQLCKKKHVNRKLKVQSGTYSELRADGPISKRFNMDQMDPHLSKSSWGGVCRRL